MFILQQMKLPWSEWSRLFPIWERETELVRKDKGEANAWWGKLPCCSGNSPERRGLCRWVMYRSPRLKEVQGKISHPSPAPLDWRHGEQIALLFFSLSPSLPLLPSLSLLSIVNPNKKQQNDWKRKGLSLFSCSPHIRSLDFCSIWKRARWCSVDISRLFTLLKCTLTQNNLKSPYLLIY